MKNFPIDKYHFYIANKVTGEPYKVIATSTYGGRTIRGMAKCSPDDNFDIAKGKELAAARCNLKVAEKRSRRAFAALCQAKKNHDATLKRFEDMSSYHDDALLAYEQAKKRVGHLLSEM